MDSADQAARIIEEAGGKVIVPPFDIRVGRCTVVEGPWQNFLLLLDTSRGLLSTGPDRNVLGNRKPD